MLKKCISLAIVCIMLAGFFVPAYADSTVSYTQYVTDFENKSLGGFEQYFPGAYINGYIDGSNLPGKTDDTVYGVTTIGKEKNFVLRLTDLTTRYSLGEKLHFSTEFFVPETNVYYDKNTALALSATFFTSSDASDTTVCSLGVKNDGNKDTRKDDRNRIIRFNPQTSRIELFGNSVYTNTKWEAGKWNKIDVVVVTGALPQAAIYVNGQPVFINVDFGNGVTYHKDNKDATFDGIKTSTEYVKVGYRDDDLKYFDTGIYGIQKLSLSMLGGKTDTDKNSIYYDNTFLKVLSATEQPEIDTALSFRGVGDGASLKMSELSALEVSVPAWFADATTKVAVYVDGAQPVYDESAPFAFDLSALSAGLHNIEISAFDAKDNLLGKVSRQLSVVPDEDVKTVFSENFDSGDIVDTPNSFLKQGSSPNNGGTAKRKISFEDVTDSDGTKKRAALLYACGNQTAVKLSFLPLTNGTGDATKVIKTGIVKVTYDMCLKDDKFSQLSFFRRDGYNLVNWDSGQKKFVTNNDWTGVKGDYSFEAEIDKWQQWEWTFDFESDYTVTLKIDGATVLDKVPLQTFKETSADKHLFYNFGISFKSTDASSVAVDNFNVTCAVKDPYFTSADFGSGNSRGGYVKTSVTSATMTLAGRAIAPADVENALQVIDVEADSALVGITASSDYANGVNTIIISGLNLEANKMYKIQLAKGMKYHTAGFVTNKPIEYTFIAVDDIPADAIADDGVAGDITVADVRYTLNGTPVYKDNVVKRYTGGTIAAGKELRADVMVNNSSSVAQTFRVALATYEDNVLTGISVSNEYTVPAKAQSMVFTSGKIDIAAAAAPDIKVMILTDENTIVPVSKAFSLDN